MFSLHYAMRLSIGPRWDRNEWILRQVQSELRPHWHGDPKLPKSATYQQQTTLFTRLFTDRDWVCFLRG